MKVSRGTVLARLVELSTAVSPKAVLEQSDCFVFSGDRAVTFNDSMMVKAPSPFDFDAVVRAADLMEVLGKVPDDEVEIFRKENEVRIKGKRCQAGIVCETEVRLPVDEVPSPKDWSRLTEGTTEALQQAATTCGRDETQFIATCVHVTPDLVEACDNYRFLRVAGPTGFSSEVLLPAASVAQLKGLDITRASNGEGWFHFRTTSKAIVSLRCSHEAYQDVTPVLQPEDGAKKLTLPANLAEIVSRAEVMTSVQKSLAVDKWSSSYDTKVGVRIRDGELIISSRKEGGWYRERKKLKYDGPPIGFEIHPWLLLWILERTREVWIGKRKMLVEVGATTYITALAAEGPKKDKGKAEADEEVQEADIPF